MHAIGYRIPLPIEEPQSLVDIELPQPAAEGRDLLVAVKAVSVNPIDTKVRRSVAPEADQWKVLGWDAAGVVVETGPQAGLFRPGDEVYYAGALARPGTNAEFHRVDERIVGRKPATLGWAEAAALPLTAITAWEALFDRLDVANRIVAGAAPAVLIVGGAGGVGSIAIQLACRLTHLAVIATASRPESRQWALDLGAHHVVDHGLPLADQVAALGLGAPAFVFCTTHTQVHAPEIARLIAPQGCFALIDSPVLDFNLFKQKSVSIHWELMFTRSMFETADMGEQGALLNRVAQLVDAGQVRTTLSETLGSIDAANLKRAHERIEGGHTRGKLVLEGF
ncbi:zinc-binding alcohol dehydrogenase family protein [Nitrosovibrio sp. Nv17]|uniref:zinc-binding alcohol dehydrogenase family protein n=1 Tax=Nitrosovibrio sp. Nv17 TaxID=1855339 RepID=UPI000908DBAE|nr:zinc-binding alcohol dehydrogenase family protein [Nitrosovibrio sp. Nv17]SFW10956.1 NADPH2:quinone reductase [Nitrosovibrio sp. Nv17]